MEWYKHHIADYMEATRELSMIQDGAYRRLLSIYYQQEGPIKVEERVVFRLCNALHYREKDAVRYVLGKFFDPIEGYYHNHRADEEILRYQRQREANRRPIRIPIGTPIGSPNRPLEKKEREERKSGACSTLEENGKPCGKITDCLLNNQWVCTKHHPYLRP